MEKLTLREHLGYGAASLGDSITYVFVGSFLMFFLTTVAHIAPAQAGVISALGAIASAVLNPILGYSSDMLFAVHSSFLWIADLAQPDKWILPIGAGIATYFSFSMSQSNGAMGASGAPGMGGAEGMMKSMKYIFPVMIVLMARSYPAGLAIYWFFSQVIQIFFNLRFRKIREEIKGEKKSRKKGKK